MLFNSVEFFVFLAIVYALYRAMGFAPVEKYLQNPVIRDPEAIEVAYLRKEL